MSHYLGVSGSIILTDPKKYDQLFNKNADHIEIGEFPDHAAFEQFITLLRKKDLSFGLHSPLYRNQSKYDLIEKVYVDPKQAWEQFESEAAYMSKLGAKYILVHFPFFKEEVKGNPDLMIEEGLKKLSKLQSKYNLPIVCEPKLGRNLSKAGIEYLHDFPINLWEKYGLHLCVDIGDYLLASGNKALEYIRKFKSYIKVVHLHNVEYIEEKDEYFWIPVHPSHETDQKYFSIREILLFLAQCKDLYFVFEHTPHTNPTDAFVREGMDWVRSLLAKKENNGG